MILTEPFKRISLSVVLTCCAWFASSMLYAATPKEDPEEDYDYKFAATPLEYGSLSHPRVKTNLIFLIDNSSFAPPLEPQKIVQAIIADQEVRQRTRVGLSYLYADTHPFISFEIPTRFILCLIQQLAIQSPELVAEISSIIAGAAAGGAGLIAVLPVILPLILEELGKIAPVCVPELQNTDLNIAINTHKLSYEVKLDDLSKNWLEVNESLLASKINNFIPPLGLPIVTRRYYEITREIRGMKPGNSFMKRPSSSSSIAGNTAKAIAEISNFIRFIPVLGPFLSGIASLLRDAVNFVGPVPEYQPLFNDAMQYRCQPNVVVVLSPSIVQPATISMPAKAIKEFIDKLREIISSALLPGEKIEVDRYLPIPDLLPLTVPEDDTLVRDHLYQSEKRTLTFEEWNHPEEQYSNDGLAFLSKLFDENDLKTSKDGVDQEGRSWDAKDYPFQNITTLAINTAGGQITDHPMLAALWQLFLGPLVQFNPMRDYLKNAASPVVRLGMRKGYFVGLSSIEQIKKIIKDTIMGVDRKNLSGAPSSLLIKKDPFSGLSAYVDTENWSSTLRFYPLIRKQAEEFDYTARLNQYYSPLYNDDRKVLVSTAQESPHFLKGTSAYNLWLLRLNSFSDKEINRKYKTNLRDRCANSSSENCEERMLGDILNTPILTLDEIPNLRNPVTDPYADWLVTAANDGMVHIFKRDRTGTTPYRLVLDYLPGAARRGNSTTLWEQLPNLAHPLYGKHKLHPHQFFGNGGLSYLGTVTKKCGGPMTSFYCIAQAAQVFMVGSYGQGARGLYAFNLAGKDYATGRPVALSNSNQQSWVGEVPLWESGSDKYGASRIDSETRKAHQALGYIPGSPVIANVAIKRSMNNELNQMKPRNEGDIRYGVFTGNGFFSDDRKPALYVFDALGISKKEGVSRNGSRSFSFSKEDSGKGSLIARIEIKDPICGHCNRQGRLGLSPPAVVDTDGDGIADVVYAGDYNGNLYRFDLRKEDPRAWSATKIYEAPEPPFATGIPEQPITTAPVVYRLDPMGSRYVVIFGTGSDWFKDDLLKNTTTLNTPKQAIYGVFDDLAEEPKQVTRRADLLKQTMSAASGSFKGEIKKTVKLSDKHMTSQYRGWYVELDNGLGERVVRPGKVAGNAVFFTTRIYKSGAGNKISYPNQCTNAVTAQSDGYLLGLNPRTGGRLKRTMVNFNPILDRYNPKAEFISGFKLEGVPSELTFIVQGQNSLTNRAGQFSSGWEDTGRFKLKHYDEGYLVVTSTQGEYYVISAAEPNYIRVRKVNSRELF
ncbi:MAG: PilC/PilY family type IV pilus protein [Neisseriaceae bacterium]